MQKESSNMKMQAVRIVYLLLSFSCLFLGMIITVFFPKDVNWYENRKAEKIGRLTAESYLDSAFQDSVENALADQIPGAQSLKKTYNSVNSGLLVDVIKKGSAAHPEEYFRYNGVYAHDDYLLWEPFDMEECRDEFEATAESFRKARENNPDTEFSLYYIENDSIFDFRAGTKKNIYGYVKSLLSWDEKQTARFELTDFEQYKEEFFRTDHHWNYKGAYRGYREILDLLGCGEAPLQPLREVALPYEFAGSKAMESGLTEFKETPTVYEFSYPWHTAPYGGEEYIIGGVRQEFSYEMFYGVNFGEYVLDTGREDRENILIIGDSFDNAILRLLSQHFHKTYSVDLRNLELPEGERFNITEYIRENAIDRVLIVASQVIFSSGDYIMES